MKNQEINNGADAMSKKPTIRQAIIRLESRGYTLSEISEAYAMPQSQVKSILNPNDMSNKKTFPKPLTDQVKSQIKSLKGQGLTNQQVADICKVAPCTVSRVMNRKPKANAKTVQKGRKKSIVKNTSRNTTSFSFLWGAFSFTRTKE